MKYPFANAIGALLTISALAAFLSMIIAQPAVAATQTVMVYPNDDTNIGAWSTMSGSGGSRWHRVNNPTTPVADGAWICSATATTTGVFNAGATANPGTTGASMPDVQQGVTIISAQVAGRTAYVFLGGTVNMQLQVLINGSSVSSATGGWSDGPLFGTGGCSGSFNSGQDAVTATANATVGSEWTQSQMNTMAFQVSRSGNSRGVRLYALNAQLSYVTYSTLTQNGYRFYQNANSTTPGAALGSAANTPIDINQDEDPAAFRLRLAVQTTNERWLRQYGAYKLQYATKNAGTCAATTGWSDVAAASGRIRWNTNGGASNGATITNVAGQPGGTMVAQRYQSANPFSKQVQVPNNQFGIWDFSLQHVGSDYGDSYCLRVVNNNGDTQPLSGYTNYPELRIVGSTLSVDIVNSSGVSVSNPKVIFPSLFNSFQCQSNMGILGTPAERIRVTDNRASGNWSLALSAADGASAKWESGSDSYSFNNPAGTPAGCQFGQLAMDFSSIGAGAKPGCTGTGLAPGAPGGFTGGTPRIIGSGTGADRFCYWDVTGVGLEQQIPGATPPGSYTIDMTLTVTAT